MNDATLPGASAAENDLLRELALAWRASGVEEGDLLLVHSDVRRTIWTHRKTRLATPALLLASLGLAVGAEGTLLLPLFHFGFARGEPFDIRETPSQMGVLTEVARLSADSVRTGHPIYSFAALGAKAELFRGVENFSGYGADSPFGMLARLDGRIAVLDLPEQSSMTFHHHVEEMENVPYRYHKTFTAPYHGREGCFAPRTFGLFVRDLGKNVRTHVTPMGERLWSKGIYKGSRPGTGTGMRTARARDVLEEVSCVIRKGEALGTLVLYDAPPMDGTR